MLFRSILVWNRYREEVIYVEDVGQGVLQTLDVPHQCTEGLRITGDGSRILQLGERVIQAWDIWTGESTCKQDMKYSIWRHLSALQMDGLKVLAYNGSLVQGWDFGVPGSTPIQFPVISSARPCLNLIEFWNSGITGAALIRIEDGVTKKEVFQLCGRYAKPSAVQWDGQYLIAGYLSGDVVILDFGHVLSK